MPRIDDKWGQQIDTKGLEELYAPQQIRPFTATPAGIDNLALSSVDVFLLPEKGGKYARHEVAFDGYFQVARAAPTSKDWETAEFYVNMTDIALHSTKEVRGLGSIHVGINKDVVSAGQVLAAGGPQAAAQCRIAAGVVFAAPERDLNMFNREPILLMNGGIKSVPPVEDPNGKAHIYLLPLYDVKRPDGVPVAYLESLAYTVGNYLSREAVEEIKARY
jgi:hypothetical protein